MTHTQTHTRTPHAPALSSIAPIIEFCDVCVTSKGIYVKPGLNPPVE